MIELSAQVLELKATLELSHKNESEYVKAVEAQNDANKTIILKQAEEITSTKLELDNLKLQV